MKKKLLIGNWKMNPQTLDEAKKIIAPLKRIAKRSTKVKIAVCVPFVFLEPIAKYIGRAPIALGAQDVFWEEEGAYTGEISPLMLKKLKVQYCLIGHSERRALGEDTDAIAKKVDACLKQKITPVICIGETARDEGGAYLDVLRRDLLACLANVKRAELKNIVIAYEPVWAISTHKTRPATPEESEETIIFFKKVLRDHFKKDVSNIITMLYGGSSNPDNTEAFLSNGGVDGLLPGSASLHPDVFCDMVKIAQNI